MDLIVALAVLTVVLFLGAHWLSRTSPPPPRRRWDSTVGAPNDGTMAWTDAGGHGHGSSCDGGAGHGGGDCGGGGGDGGGGH